MTDLRYEDWYSDHVRATTRADFHWSDYRPPTIQGLAGVPHPEGATHQPATLISLHTVEHLPCPACTFGVRSGQLDGLDWCADCGHFHVEMDCPVRRPQ